MFADLTGEPGAPDDLKVNTAANVYCAGAGGIYMLDPQGKSSVASSPGALAATHIGCGGRLENVVLGSVDIKIAGIPAPPRRRLEGERKDA